MSAFHVKPLETERDVDENLELMRIVFGEEEGVDAMTRRLLERQPGFGLGNFLTVRHEGKMVASLNIIPQTWSIGGIPLKVAEMGMVTTLPEYRKRGLQRTLNAHYDEYIAEGGFDLSVIEGIPFFYRQFGYEYTIPLDVEAEMPLSKIAYEKTPDIRPFRRSDISKAVGLLGESQKKFLVHSVRPEAVWRAQEETGWQADWAFKGFVLEERGEVVAYFRLSLKGDTIYLVEISNTNNRQADKILGFIRSYGEELGASRLVTRVSHSEPIIDELLKSGGEAHKPYAWQVKIVDHKRVFENLAPLFTKRIADSRHRNLTDDIKINLYRQCLALNIVDGKVERVVPCEGLRKDEIRINPVVFPKLLLGAASREELEDDYPDVSVKPRYRELIDVLFPKGNSYIHPCY